MSENMLELLLSKLDCIRSYARAERSLLGKEIALYETDGPKDLLRHERYFYYGMIERSVYHISRSLDEIFTDDPSACAEIVKAYTPDSLSRADTGTRDCYLKFREDLSKAVELGEESIKCINPAIIPRL